MYYRVVSTRSLIPMKSTSLINRDRSSVDNLVSKVLLQRSNSTSNNTHHTASLNSAEDSLSPRPHCHPFGRTSRTSGALRSSWRFKGSGPGTRDVLSPTGFSDGFTDDDSEDEGAAAISRAGAGKRQSSRQTESVGPEFGVGGEVKGGEGGLVRAKEGLGRKGPEPACDIVLEAVSTGGMLHEMMSALPAEVSARSKWHQIADDVRSSLGLACWALRSWNALLNRPEG